MNDLDQDIAGLVAPMIRGDPQTLRSDEIYQLATWITKLALVYESLNIAHQLVPRAAYERFYQKRQPFEREPIRLAKYAGTEFKHAFAERVIPMHYGFGRSNVEGILITFLIGAFIAQASLPVETGRGPVVADEDARTTVIWPNLIIGETLWPPPKSIPSVALFLALAQPI